MSHARGYESAAFNRSKMLYRGGWGYSDNSCFKSLKSRRLLLGRKQIIASTLA